MHAPAPQGIERLRKPQADEPTDRLERRREQVAQELREEHRTIQALADELRERDVETTALLIQGPTVEAILQEAEKLSADLIVLGSHGHGAIYRSLLGSVSEGVLHRARVPVAIVPTREES